MPTTAPKPTRTNHRALGDVLDQPPPQSIEAEQAVLGSMLLDTSTVPAVLTLLTSDSFLRQAHQRIFICLRDLHSSGVTSDALILMDDLKRRDWLDDIGEGELTAQYIGEILDRTISAANARHYARIVADCASKRRLRDLGVRLIRDAHNGEPADRILLNATEDFERLKRPVTDRFTLLSSTDFAVANYKLDWLAKPMLVRGQPGIIGGPMKVLKTSVAVDLAVALSTATPFLGAFPVSERHNVALLSGESGEPVLQDTARRICTARMRCLSDCSIRWGFRLPQLSRASDLSALGDALTEHAIEVLIVDPLYLCLLAGDTEGRSASNMFDIGPLLLAVAQMAAECGCTPILLHHFRKTLADAHAPAELPDLAYSGVAEFARQWLLLSRREQYEPGSGSHKLWLSVGGSAGHSGLYAVDVSEGATGDDFSGRTWRVDVRPATQARQDEKQRREAEQKASKVQKVLAVVSRYPDGETMRFLAEVTGMRFATFADIVADLEKVGRVERCEINKPWGKGTRTVPAIRPAGGGKQP
jgi:replicative DNA helicase